MEQKDIVDHLVHFLTTIIASLTTVYVAFRIFRKSTEKDIRFKTEQIERETNDKYLKIFGELFSLQHSLNDELHWMNENALDTKFYYQLRAMYKANPESAKEFTELARESEKKLNLQVENVKAVNKQIFFCVGQYIFLNPNSKCKTHLEKFIETPINVGFADIFQNVTTKDELIAIRKIQSKRANEHSKCLTNMIGQISNCVFKRD